MTGGDDYTEIITRGGYALLGLMAAFVIILLLHRGVRLSPHPALPVAVSGVRNFSGASAPYGTRERGKHKKRHGDHQQKHADMKNNETQGD